MNTQKAVTEEMLQSSVNPYRENHSIRAQRRKFHREFRKDHLEFLENSWISPRGDRVSMPVEIWKRMSDKSPKPRGMNIAHRITKFWASDYYWYHGISTFDHIWIIEGVPGLYKWYTSDHGLRVPATNIKRKRCLTGKIIKVAYHTGRNWFSINLIRVR